MQVNVNQDAAIRQYTQNVQSAKAVTAPAADTKEEASASAVQKDVDRAEFSKDTAVTGKMSDSERAALVQSLKDDLNNQMSRFTNMMTQMFQKQGISANLSQGNDFWRFMASGNYSVDAKTKAEAQAAISEDGYWGVSKTSQRIFDFAHALAGDDPEKMKEMQAAVEKGFKQAEEAWGGSLPSICGDTHAAIGKLFDDFYAKNGATA
ncbi:MAG: hypothetical protein HFI15_14940 [Lachnospiraceae bacterium]|jgi:hypothetical protein|nr:hypothetical protein [Lachnospiraceae bacterium]